MYFLMNKNRTHFKVKFEYKVSGFVVNILVVPFTNKYLQKSIKDIIFLFKKAVTLICHRQSLTKHMLELQLYTSHNHWNKFVTKRNSNTYRIKLALCKFRIGYMFPKY